MKTQERARFADPLPLAQELIRCQSVFEAEQEAAAVVEEFAKGVRPRPIEQIIGELIPEEEPC